MNVDSVGVLGGSFNPIHLGHIELAVRAHEQFDLPLVLLMPVNVSYYKDSSNYASSKHRLKMTELAAGECGAGFLKSSSADIDRGGVTYTCDTVDELKKTYKKIFFIVGSDSLMYIDKWKNADVFLKKIIVLYAKRDGDTADDLLLKVDYLKENFNADVRELSIRNHPISSSDIREKIKKGVPLTGLVPKSVEEYIKKNDLYK